MKDKSNNIAIIKLINFFCFTLKTIKIDLDNIHFYCKYEEFTNSKGNTSYHLPRKDIPQKKVHHLHWPYNQQM